MTGFYLMHRGWLDHPAFGGAREPYCRRAAWAWLVEHASWKGERQNIAGKTVALRRGQLSYSLRFLGKAWGWDTEKVRRFCLRLSDEGMIETESEAGQMVITICNYDQYQAPVSGGEAVGEAAARQHQGGGEANKKEGKEGKEGNSLSLSGEGAPAPDERGIVATPPANDNPKRGRQGTPVPDGDLPDEWAAAANHSREKHLLPLLGRRVLNLRWESFQNYWRGVTGSKGLKRDWRATWLNDCIDSRTEKRFPPEGGAGPPQTKPRPQLFDLLKSNDKY